MFDHVAIYFGTHLILRSLSIGQINKNDIPSQVGLKDSTDSKYLYIFLYLYSPQQCMGRTSKSTVYGQNI